MNVPTSTRVLLLRRAWGRSNCLLMRGAQAIFAFLPCPRNILVEKLLNPRCEAVQG